MATVLDLDEQQSESSVGTPEPNETQPEPQAKESQQSEKNSRNWNADELLTQHFAQPIRFITYAGIRDLSKVRTKRYTIWGIDTNREGGTMAKLGVLFAFPKEKMPDLKPYVKIRKALKAEKLRPIRTIADRYHVDNELLKQAKANKSNVNVVTRSGHVLQGSVQHFDKYILYVQIGGQTVVVYRHGLFDFTIETQSEDAS